MRTLHLGLIFIYSYFAENFNPSITPHPASIDSQALVSTRVSNTTDHTSKHIDTQSTREKLSGSNTSKKEEGVNLFLLCFGFIVESKV